MRICFSEYDGDKIVVRLEDGRRKVIWRKGEDGSDPPVSPIQLAGMEEDEAEYAIETGFFLTVEHQIAEAALAIADHHAAEDIT